MRTWDCCPCCAATYSSVGYHAGIMLRRTLQANLWPVLALFLLVPMLARAAAATPAAPLNVEGLGQAVIPLDGNWQFHVGDDPAWASPALDDSGWEPIAVDQPWGAQTHFGYTGYAWYRRHINFVGLPAGVSDLALLMPPINDVYEVYWNGARIGQLGTMPPNPTAYVGQPGKIIGLTSPASGVLAFRVWKAPYSSADSGEAGGLNRAPRVGTRAAIDSLKATIEFQRLRNRLFSFGVDLIYAVMVVFGFLAWLRDRNQKVLFWMSAWAFSLLLSVIVNQLRLPISNGLTVGLVQPILSLADVSIWFLLLYLLELHKRPLLSRWTRILACISVFCGAADGLLAILDWSGPHVVWYQIADAALTFPTMLIEVFPLVLIGFAIGKRLDAARWSVAILAALSQLILGFQNITGQGERFTHWTISNKVNIPLFHLGGNAVNLPGLCFSLLLVAVLYAVYRYSAEQSDRQAALEQEFRSAQELQQVLIPETLPSLEGYAVTSAYRPAQQVGGDFFQLITQPDGSALLFLGDVSGKGLKAAMTVSLIVGTLRTAADTSDDPAEILAVLNRRLHSRLQNGFVTCLALRLDSEGNCVVANAGHLSPFLNKNELNLPGALPLGLDLSVEYEKIYLRLAIGDRLMLYTDGLLEARNAAGELYSFDRLHELIATQPDAKQATDAAVAFGQDDDVTVITLTRLAPGVEATISLVKPDLVSV
jgi:phosphoserine phosphatase RsbU/P